jgi:hypothetical protein
MFVVSASRTLIVMLGRFTRAVARGSSRVVAFVAFVAFATDAVLSSAVVGGPVDIPFLILT